MPAEKQSQSSFQFSLRQIFIVVAGVALGLSIRQMPEGRAADILLTPLATMVIVSLVEQAAATWRKLHILGLMPEERSGGWVLLVSLAALAITLVIAIVCRLLAANKVILVPQFQFWQPDFEQTLSWIALLLALIGATSISRWTDRLPRSTRLRDHFASAIGILLVIPGLLVYAASLTLIIYLVQIAVNGVDLAQPLRYSPPHILPSVESETQCFLNNICTAGGITATNFLLIAAAVRCWDRRILRLLSVGGLAIGLSLQTYLAYLLGRAALKSLSWEMLEGFNDNRVGALTLVGGMIALVAWWLAWNRLAYMRPIDERFEIPVRRRYFHETWPASFVLAIVPMVIVGEDWLKKLISATKTLPGWSWWRLVYLAVDFLYRPVVLIGLVAALAGFAQAWRRFRREPVRDVLPTISVIQFAVVELSIFVFITSLAIIAATLGYAVWHTRIPVQMKQIISSL